MMPPGSVHTLLPPPKTQVAPQLLAPRLLVIEDDSDLLPILARVVHGIDPDMKVDWASGADDARAAINSERYHAILSDYMLADSDTGLVLYQDCVKYQPQARFAMMSALPITLPDETCQLLRKPFTIAECHEFLSRLMMND